MQESFVNVLKQGQDTVYIAYIGQMQIYIVYIGQMQYILHSSDKINDVFEQRRTLWAAGKCVCKLIVLENSMFNTQ